MKIRLLKDYVRDDDPPQPSSGPRRLWARWKWRNDWPEQTSLSDPSVSLRPAGGTHYPARRGWRPGPGRQMPHSGENGRMSDA
jgi:hypothetical protein